MKKLSFLFLFFSIQTLFASEVVDRVVAVVGNEVITLSDVKKVKATKDTDPLETLIRDKLLHQEIDRMNLNVTDEELAGSIQEVLSRNKVTLDQLKNELIKKGTSLEDYKKELSGQIRRMKFMAQVIYPRMKISEGEVSKKMAGLPSNLSKEEARFRARYKLYEEKSPEELNKYLDEVRAKTFVEIKQ